MMKTSRIVLGICGIIAGVAVVLAGVWFISNAGNPSMDRTEALQYALADAGLEESEITITKQNLERDDGKNYYEIEFYSASYAYEYEIDARNGAVLDVSIEALFSRQNADTAQSNGTAAQPQPSGEAPSVPDTLSAPDTQITPEVPSGQDGRISVDAAKAAALADAGFTEADVVITKAELDRDDGVEEYDIEFYVGSTEYEYEINAATGAIISRDVDYDSAGVQQTIPEVPAAQDGRIGVDAAKAAALADAGFTEADVVFTKAELDRDDGVEEYDIEFYVGSTEYEYEINAATGEIISRDIDYDPDDYGGYRGSHDSHHIHHCWHK